MAKALSLRAIDRFKSIAEFRAALGWVVQPRAASVPINRTTTSEPVSDVRTAALNALPLDVPVAKSARPATVGLTTMRPAQSPDPAVAIRVGRGASYEAPPRSGTKLLVALVIGIVAAVALVFALR